MQISGSKMSCTQGYHPCYFKYLTLLLEISNDRARDVINRWLFSSHEHRILKSSTCALQMIYLSLTH